MATALHPFMKRYPGKYVIYDSNYNDRMVCQQQTWVGVLLGTYVDDAFKLIFLKENICIMIEILLKLVPKVKTSNMSSLVQVMVWHL